MQLELRHLNQQLGITFIYVTHDQEEALTMSDRIALMRSGRIVQLSAPRDMYERPVSKYVADFIGETNLLPGTITSAGDQSVRLTVAGVTLEAATARPWEAGATAWLAIRPEYVRQAEGSDDGPAVTVTVREAVFTGAVTRLYTALADGTPLVLHWPAGEAIPAAGSSLAVSWPMARGICVGE
jgi:ABC-type Fe3+/spermidine/putrescine transport system ATPase subunit